MIFGSQLLALQKLNEHGPLQKAELKPLYEEARTEFSVFYTHYSFDQWFHFLLNQVLVLVNGENVAITVRGKEFLKFLVQESHSMDKIG